MMLETYVCRDAAGELVHVALGSLVGVLREQYDPTTQTTVRLHDYDGVVVSLNARGYEVGGRCLAEHAARVEHPKTNEVGMVPLRLLTRPRTP